jgi:DNA-binding MarR family transcriptional regulator
MEGDYVERILNQWKRERPDLDMSPVGIVGRVYRLTRVLESRLSPTFDSVDLKRGGFDVLAALRRSGPPHRLSPTALYNSLLITSGAMTNRIDRLEEVGLVKRTPAPDDRRALLVTLTDEGKRLVDTVTTDLARAEHLLLSSLSDEEQKELARLLKSLLMVLEDSEGTGPSENELARRADRVESLADE